MRLICRALGVLTLLVGCVQPFIVIAAPGKACYVKKETWLETVLASREALEGASNKGLGGFAILEAMEEDFPIEWDWLRQDLDDGAGFLFEKGQKANRLASAIVAMTAELGESSGFEKKVEQLEASKVSTDDRRWIELYFEACQERRAVRLSSMVKSSGTNPIVFTAHHNLGGSHYAYTEAQSDAQAERNFHPGASLNLLEMRGTTAHVKTLLSDAKGVIRDPAVSYDGTRILFSWKKSDRNDDYHLYEMELKSGTIRQLTFGLGMADYEGTYLPNGDIIFNSTRCVQTVDCWWTEVSNLYTCDKDGKHIRRLTFDQVHNNYPTVLDDGRVIYTRWEYNDRGQVFTQPLYQMNYDGTGQAEFYGNNSWFPTTILHARGIPGTEKVLAIATGHHSMQAGKLIIIDPSKGRQEASGVQLIAPVRPTPAERIDAYGQQGEMFQNPYPLSEDSFLVSYHPVGWEGHRRNEFLKPNFKLYFMMKDGRRELLAADPHNSCSQPVLVAPRSVVLNRPSLVDYTKSMGTVSMQSIYLGEGLKGIEPGTVKKLRVVTLDFRAAGVGQNGSSGPAGGALSSTPVSINNGSWDPKIVLGEATVHEDGSAFFQVPARQPVYFQAIDAKGHVVQTMRSWATLQPGENTSCVGCHESKNSSAWSANLPVHATQTAPEALKPFYGPARPFSFSTEIQPILNEHCVKCHNKRPDDQSDSKGAFSLLGEVNSDAKAGRFWSDSYLALTQNGTNTAKTVNWIGVQSVPTLLPPYFLGAAKSGLITLLEKGHAGVKLNREELDKIACWIDLQVPYCGDYTEAAFWSEDEYAKYDHYLQKRRRIQEAETTEVQATLAKQNPSLPAIRMELVDANGTRVNSDRPFQPGDRLKIDGPPHIVVRWGKEMPEFTLYSPMGHFEITVPLQAGESNAYSTNFFRGVKSLCSVRSATLQDLSTYRNVALNPLDVRGISSSFPHATANSECRNEPVFAARNAIDGSTNNTGHGKWPYQSWGPDQRSDLWWKVDLGRAVEVDKVILTLRADFPHDRSWNSAVLRFSDGSMQRIELQATAQPQSFQFEKRKASWVQLEDLKQELPLGWCALTEVQVFGHD